MPDSIEILLPGTRPLIVDDFRDPDLRCDRGHWSGLHVRRAIVSCILLGGLQRQSYLKTGSARLGFERDLSAMATYNTVYSVQTQARAFADSFRREERLKKVRPYHVRNTWTVVDHHA